ncbi:MAG: hypothetical protein JJW01_01200 [Alphaproteobacteria bacterium]|nr:hypothetical protein [Rickettsiales bacterium]
MSLKTIEQSVFDNDGNTVKGFYYNPPSRSFLKTELSVDNFLRVRKLKKKFMALKYKKMSELTEQTNVKLSERYSKRNNHNKAPLFITALK